MKHLIPQESATQGGKETPKKRPVLFITATVAVVVAVFGASSRSLAFDWSDILGFLGNTDYDYWNVGSLDTDSNATDVFKTMEFCTYACDYEMSARFYVPDGATSDADWVTKYVNTDLNPGAVSSPPLISNTDGSIVQVHTHQLSAETSINTLTVSEAEAVCDGTRIPVSAPPSLSDFASLLSQAALSSSNGADPTKVEGIIYQPGGTWSYSIKDMNNPVMKEYFATGDSTSASVLAYRDVTNPYGGGIDLASPDPAVRDAATQQAQLAAEGMGMDLQFTPDQYYNGGAPIPGCVVSGDQDKNKGDDDPGKAVQSRLSAGASCTPHGGRSTFVFKCTCQPGCYLVEVSSPRGGSYMKCPTTRMYDYENIFPPAWQLGCHAAYKKCMWYTGDKCVPRGGGPLWTMDGTSVY